MIVCVCNRVSEKTIAQHAHEGKSFDDIQFELLVATQCGSCENCARELVERCHRAAAARCSQVVGNAGTCGQCVYSCAQESVIPQQAAA